MAEGFAVAGPMSALLMEVLQFPGHLTVYPISVIDWIIEEKSKFGASNIIRDFYAQLKCRLKESQIEQFYC